MWKGRFLRVEEANIRGEQTVRLLEEKANALTIAIPFTERRGTQKRGNALGRRNSQHLTNQLKGQEGKLNEIKHSGCHRGKICPKKHVQKLPLLMITHREDGEREHAKDQTKIRSCYPLQ